MAKLYSYCIINGHGAAPNPFWGVCTLAICKPVIRRSAQVGDWIAATGSSKYNFENKLVYAMKVSEVMTMEEYDKLCSDKLQNKIPVFKTTDLRVKVGDCIYDYSSRQPELRRAGVHEEENVARDLGGLNVLLSDHFYYFGSKPIPLPTHLLAIVRQGQGHKSLSNNNYVNDFIQWITTFKKQKNKVNASPYGLNLYADEEFKNKCSRLDLEEDDADEKNPTF